MAKTLIAYFSRADENYFGGAMRYVKVGNTEIVCGLMQELIDAGKTGINAGVRTVGVTWGFRSRAELEAYAPWRIVDTPEALAEAILEPFGA